MTLLQLDNIPAMQAEVRALAAERGAVILAHNYQLPEIQDVADYVGDSLGLSVKAAATPDDVIAFCGVHFMAETASILSPGKTVLLPDLDAGCSLADSITAEQLRAWKAKHPGAVVVMYVNTTAEVKAETDYCVTSSNAVAVVEHIYREHGAGTEILFGPDMFLGAYVEKVTGRKMHVWDGECHVHAGIRPSDISDMRAAHPGADFLIHPECGCSTSVMEYVAAGRRRARGRAHALDRRDARLREHAEPGTTAIMATEVGMLHPLRMAAPDVDFVAANEAASCRYMKMITLPKLRDALRAGEPVVKVPAGDRRAGAPADRADGRDRAVVSGAAATRDVARAGVRGDRARRRRGRCGRVARRRRRRPSCSRRRGRPASGTSSSTSPALLSASSRSAGVRSEATTSPADESSSIRSALRSRASTSPALLESVIDGAVDVDRRHVARRGLQLDRLARVRSSATTSPASASARTSVPDGTRIS